MASLTGTIRRSDDTPHEGWIRIETTGPAMVGGLMITGQTVDVPVTTGSFSTTIKAGVYRISVACPASFKITIPDDAGTYTLEEVIDEGVSQPPSP